MTEENLGKAVLTIEIRDEEAKAAIAALKKSITDLDADLVSKTKQATGPGTKPRTRSITDNAASFEDRLAKARTRATNAAEKEIQQRRKATQGRISSGLIGGAFPLLFGQGGGAAAGGLLGGVAGGGPFGFGASLVGTLLGSQIDLLSQRFTELGTALQNPIASFDVFIEKATLASKAQESLASALADTGQTAAAAELIRKEATRTIDPIAAEGAVTAQDNFNRTLSDTQDLLGNIVSGPARGFLDFLTDTLKFLGAAPKQTQQNIDPLTSSIKSANEAAGKLGVNVGGVLSGLTLAAAGVATTFASGGAGAGFGVPLFLSGLSVAGIGGAGASAASKDLRVAESAAVIEAETEVAAAIQRQLDLEKQILTAKAQNKKGAVESLNVQAQFNALRVEELQGLSRIQQELAGKQDGFNDLEDQAAAIRQEKELTAAINLRRQALLAVISAQQAESVTQRKTAESLSGTSGVDREILSIQIGISNATKDAYDAQLRLNAARKEGSGVDDATRRGLEQKVNTLINNRITTEIEGSEKILSIRRDIAQQIRIAAAETESINQRASDVGSLRSAAPGTERDRLRTQQAADLAVADARRREEEIRTQIQQTPAGNTEAISALNAELNKALAQTALSAEEGALAIQQFNEQVQSQGIAEARSMLESQFQESQSALATQEQKAAAAAQEAGNNFKSAAQRYIEAQEGVKNAERAAFDYLDTSRQQRLVQEALDLIGAADLTNISGLSAKEIVGVGQLAKGILDAERVAETSREDLTTAMNDLASKDWNVFVAVTGGEASTYGDVLNKALSA